MAPVLVESDLFSCPRCYTPVTIEDEGYSCACCKITLEASECIVSNSKDDEYAEDDE